VCNRRKPFEKRHGGQTMREEEEEWEWEDEDEEEW